MTKSQLIDRVSEKLPRVPRRDIETIVHTVFESMLDTLRHEQRIEIRGFGSFAVKIRDPRDGRNPKTGQKVHVPRRRIPYFTVGKDLRDRLNPQRPEGPPASAGYNSSGMRAGGSQPQSFAASSEPGPRYPIR